METLTLEQIYFLSEIIGVIAVVISLVKIIFKVPFIYRQQAGSVWAPHTWFDRPVDQIVASAI